MDSLKAPASLSQPGAVAATVAALKHQGSHLCAWRDNASPKTFGSLLLPPLAGAAPSLALGIPHMRETLRRRYAGLLLLPYLPQLSPTLSPRLEQCAAAASLADVAALRTALLAMLAPSRTETGVESERRWVAALLALTGWRAGTTVAASAQSAGASSTVLPPSQGVYFECLECPEDARLLGLWHYERLQPERPLWPATAASPNPTRPPGQSCFSSQAFSPQAAPAPRVLASTPSLSSAAGASLADTAELGDGFRGPPTPKRLRLDHAAASLKAPLDPLAEHRAWSPWLAITPGDSLEAWMRCAALLLSPQSAAPQLDLSSAAATRNALALL